MFLHRKQKISAIEFPKGLEWLNSDPLTLRSLRGKVVLLDFWTYSCVNCLRTLDHLRAWHKKYANKGLVIIGVHAPEFEFEKKEENVTKAVKRLKLPYPIVLDSQYKLWSAYDNRWWPRKLLINKDGEIVYDHVGEGGYAQTEAEIQEALHAVGQGDFPIIAPDPLVGGLVHHRITPEIYFGFLRGKFGNAVGYVPGNEHVFTDVGEHADDQVYLHGHWVIEKENINHTRALAHSTEYIAIRYSAFEVNLVAGSTKKNRACELVVELDGQSLPEDMAGDDVKVKNGIATVLVCEARMYNIIRSKVYHRGTLKIKTDCAHLALYAMTF
ncbi:redoxin family protein [Patescibacteria group bacterium]|nr:redoxin family protein [Patescibacteria group bacterium]MBU4452734.1 redoxin family protein [Patescibacteria group bacterium]